MKKSYLNFIITGIIISFSYATMSQSNAGQQAKKGAGKGALIGAIALFKVEQESNNRDHRLTGLWLEGVAEKDRRDKEKANELLGKIVDADDDIDDLQMASIAVDQYVIDLRNDRKAENISCK